MPNLLAQFTGRQHSPLVQFIKYAIAGGIATIVNIVLFYACAFLLLPALDPTDAVAKLLHVNVSMLPVGVRARNSMIDNGVAFIFSNLTAYIINIFWVFESGRHSRVREILFFYLVSGVSFVIGTSLMGFLIHHFGLMTTIAFAANGVVSLLINYALRKYFIFKG
ncbi:MAG TPA: GtrA family protein [Verrucomicrobiae bacterium]|nr:GtrA family protein [Verrucomicrobiae bacterium]